MTINISNQIPYLRTSRKFPLEAEALSVELDKSYIDIANVVNQRTISLFPAGSTAVTGESWYLTNKDRFSGFRQVYPITGTGNVAHNINTSQIMALIRIWGAFVDGSGVWYPLPYVDATAANNQIQISVTSSNIVITAGGGSPPTISSGNVVLEWIV